MCTVAGAVVFRRSRETYNQLKKLMAISELRGADGFGLLVASRDRDRFVYKTTSPVTEVIDNSEFDQMVEPEIVDGSIIIWNCRAHTLSEPSSTDTTKIHPFCPSEPLRSQKVWAPNWYAVHNGLLSNDEELAFLHGFDLRTGVDSEVIPNILASYAGVYPDNGLSLLKGGFAILAVHTDVPLLLVAKNYKTLYHGRYKDELYVVASEKYMLESVFGKSNILGNFYTESVPVNSHHTVYTNGYSTESRKFDPNHNAPVPMLNSDKAVVIASGGMDSSTAAYIAKHLHNKEVTMLHFNYGQKAWHAEDVAVRKVAFYLGAKLEVFRLDDFVGFQDSPLVDLEKAIPLGKDSTETAGCWVPARNLVMLSLAASYCEARGIKYLYYGGSLEESGTYPDNGLSFEEAMNQVLEVGTLYGVKLRNALTHLMRWEVLELGVHLGVPYQFTCSCDDPHYEKGKWMGCGDCGCCTSRRHAFVRARKEDLQIYNKPMRDIYSWHDEYKELGVTELSDERVEYLIERVTEGFDG
jgi:7-cyano-7-deazaguanine synthase